MASSPVINPNPALQTYYNSLESRIGYRLFLGGTRHFGYYPSKSSNPLRINSSLRAMESQMLDALSLPKGSAVVDAGCGAGYVALFMARTGGLRVNAIDVVQHHVDKARRNVEEAGMADMVSVRRMDYHHLESFEAEQMDGLYTMETFVHATDPRAALRGFLRVLKPGGRLAMHEYDHVQRHEFGKKHEEALVKVNEYSAMPANAMFDFGVLEAMLKEEGFVDVQLKDLSPHVVPMLLLFYLVAYIPYIFIRLFRLEKHFVNTMAGVEVYRGRSSWRYVQITASKPERPAK